jgi:choline-glycine betaine transporter
MQKLGKIFLIIIFLIFAVNFSYADLKAPEIPKDSSAPIQGAQDIINIFGGILRMLSIIFWIFAVGATFYAGYLYILSGGVEEKIGKAKKMLWYAIIAIVIGLMAYGLPQLVKSFLKIR